jgi:DNA-binding MurR/RpiR family transcriptional regulator
MMTETEAGKPVEGRIFDVYDGLPASERRLADVVLECQGDLASYSASELAERAGVSKATTSRLFRRLGYARFTDARREARDSGMLWGSPLSIDSEDGSPVDSRDFLSDHLNRDLQNLGRTFQSLRPEAIGEAVGLLVGARCVWIMGFRNSHALAHYARSVLTTIKPDVRLVPGTALEVAEDLASLSARDAVLAIGRRPQLFRRLLALVNQRGVPIVMVTDPTASTATRHATVVLRCHNWGSAMFDSYASAISVLNLLCSRTAAQLGPAARDRLVVIEDIHRELDDLVSGSGDRAILPG